MKVDAELDQDTIGTCNFQVVCVGIKAPHFTVVSFLERHEKASCFGEWLFTLGHA